MQPSKLTDAQQHWLDQELEQWRSDQIVSAEQAELIRSRYETADAIHDRKRSAAVQILFGMATFLFGLAVLLLIGFNWDELSREIKLATVLTVITATHLVAFRLRNSGNFVAVSEYVSCMGCLLFGAGIWLIAQAYHLEGDYPDGVWWWAVGVLPFALCLDTLLLHMLFVFLLGLWGGMEVFGYWSRIPQWMLGWGSLPNGAYSLPLLAAPGLAWAYFRKSPLAVALYVPLFAWWAILQAFAMRLDGRAVFWIGNVGALLILFAEAHRPRDARGVPYRFWGVILVSGVLLALGSPSFWPSVVYGYESYHSDSQLVTLVTETVANLVLLGVCAGLLLIFRGAGAFNLYETASDPDSRRRRWFAILLVSSLMLMPIWGLLTLNSTQSNWVPIILANVAALAMALYLVKVGEQEDRTRPFAAGVMMFLLWAFVRYIDLFSDHGGMLGAALIFALCGAGLVIVGNFWSRKRHALRTSTAVNIVVAPTPTWIDQSITWFRDHRTAILMSTAIAQVSLLGGMILIESVPLVIGERMLVRVTPVDPRDLFRGDYVVLNYDFNNLPVPGEQRSQSIWDSRPVSIDQPVYLAREREPDNLHWKGTEISLSPPAGKKYLRGRITGDYRQRLKFGIEAYYVQEGQGLVWENLRNARGLDAEIAVAPWGQAKLVQLIAQ